MKNKRGDISDLYYYTTVETMRFILQNANIFATNLKYMNDSEEYTNGLRELRSVLNQEYGKGKELISEKQLNEYILTYSEIYSISFSGERDLLSQWSMYAKESGVSLNMDFSSSRKYFAFPEQNDEGDRRLVSRLELKPTKVYYFTKQAMRSNEYGKVKKSIIGNIESKYGPISIADIDDNISKIWLDTVPYVKRYEFNAEREYRLAFNRQELLERFRIDYREDKHVLKPYIDVKCDGGWPIAEIIVGPGFNQQATYASIVHFIEHASLIVPSITGKQFQLRCKKCLCPQKEMSEAMNLIWIKKCQGLADIDVKKRYYLFKDLVSEIHSNGNISDKEKNYIDNRFLSEEGLLISKSEIPYIY